MRGAPIAPVRIAVAIGLAVSASACGAPAAGSAAPAVAERPAPDTTEATEAAEPPATTAEPGALTVGERLFGRYEILELLGRAEPIAVYRAREWRGTQVRPVLVRTSTDIEADAGDAQRMLGRADVPARTLEVATDTEARVGYQILVVPRDQPIPLEWLLRPQLLPEEEEEQQPPPEP